VEPAVVSRIETHQDKYQAGAPMEPRSAILN
jgi:hypothetical protein